MHSGSDAVPFPRPKKIQDHDPSDFLPSNPINSHWYSTSTRLPVPLILRRTSLSIFDFVSEDGYKCKQHMHTNGKLDLAANAGQSCFLLLTARGCNPKALTSAFRCKWFSRNSVNACNWSVFSFRENSCGEWEWRRVDPVKLAEQLDFYQKYRCITQTNPLPTNLLSKRSPIAVTNNRTSRTSTIKHSLATPTPSQTPDPTSTVRAMESPRCHRSQTATQLVATEPIRITKGSVTLETIISPACHKTPGQWDITGKPR